MKDVISIFWFRRDLRLSDNTALFELIKSESSNVVPLFILDTEILADLKPEDKRVSFIYHHLKILNSQLQKLGSALNVLFGKPSEVFAKLDENFLIERIYCNADYEPYALERDTAIESWAKTKSIDFQQFHDHVFFAPGSILKGDGSPYLVYTPFSKAAYSKGIPEPDTQVSMSTVNWYSGISEHRILDLEDYGFKAQKLEPTLLNFDAENFDASNYQELRNTPSEFNGTSKLGPHLRFGTISVRQAAKQFGEQSSTFVNELLWREFFIHILWHFPHTTSKEFKPKYSGIKWRNNEKEFAAWKEGRTGYPLVDAGIRELISTGNMHNRVRMVVASFLVKHLLIDWRWGEAFFAEHLLDFELASNVGNWQWVAGTGCDAAPYFRVFNPFSQHEKFDKESVYVKKWVPEFGSLQYCKPIVEHKFARQRALDAYKAL